MAFCIIYLLMLLNILSVFELNLKIIYCTNYSVGWQSFSDFVHQLITLIVDCRLLS